MNELENKIVASIADVLKDKFNYQDDNHLIMIEIPKDNTNGDYSTNIAMRLTKILKDRPQNIANIIKDGLLVRLDNVEKIEIAGPGFINFWIKKTALANIINTVIKENENYGSNNIGNGEKVLVEYVSANPTGILHLGHARGAAWGDSLTRLMKKSGYDVLREYYINDAGNQMDMLALSLQARYRELFNLDFKLPDDGYHGQDVINIAKIIKENDGDKWLNVSNEEQLQFFKTEGKRLEMKRIADDLDYFRCHFDSWISEKSIFEAGKVEQVMNKMNQLGLTYDKDGAIWFKSTQYGDDKDRVLKKSDGYYTYLTPDIANHMYKFDRGYTKLINLWGADHHGYIPRMKAAIHAMGYPENSLEVDIIQMVRLVENGEEVKMSKRSGNAVTIRELCDDIGVDCARYFFLSRALDTHLDFDLGLAKTQSNENPVYYAQYAYARICSILKASKDFSLCESYDLLIDEKETELLKYINEFPKVVGDAASSRAVNKICNYIQKLAAYFHSFYGANKIIDDNNKDLTNQRLALVKATQITLKNALDLLGVTAPEKM